MFAKLSSMYSALRSVEGVNMPLWNVVLASLNIIALLGFAFPSFGYLCCLVLFPLLVINGVYVATVLMLYMLNEVYRVQIQYIEDAMARYAYIDHSEESFYSAYYDI